MWGKVSRIPSRRQESECEVRQGEGRIQAYHRRKRAPCHACQAARRARRALHGHKGPRRLSFCLPRRRVGFARSTHPQSRQRRKGAENSFPRLLFLKGVLGRGVKPFFFAVSTSLFAAFILFYSSIIMSLIIESSTISFNPSKHNKTLFFNPRFIFFADTSG